MDDQLKKLFGSKTNDFMKWLHKQSPFEPSWRMMDIDALLLWANEPCAVIDYKTKYEQITQSEEWSYLWFLGKGIPCYIVRIVSPSVTGMTVEQMLESVNSFRFAIEEMHSFENEISTMCINRNANINGLAEWERSIREKKRISKQSFFD